jgi:hypothetical protein
MFTQIRKTSLNRLLHHSGNRPQAGKRQLVLMVRGAMVLFLLCWITIGQAEEGKGEIKTIRIAKQIQGKISGIGKDYITICYERDKEKGIEYEMLLPIEKDIKLVHKSSLSEIWVDDTVKISYEETQGEYEVVGKEGIKERRTKVIARQAKMITFVRREIPEMEIKETLRSAE